MFSPAIAANRMGWHAPEELRHPYLMKHYSPWRRILRAPTAFTVLVATFGMAWSPARTVGAENTDPDPKKSDSPSLPTLARGTPCLLVEPSLMGHKHAQAIPGASKTVLVPGRIGLFGVEVTPPEAFAATGMKWPEFVKKASEVSQAVLDRLSPKVTRDEDGFVESAVFRSESDLTASLLYAPGFLKRFEKSMGEKLLVAIPDRNTLFVFPRAMGTFRKFGKEVVTLYEEATYPCSIELFEVTSEGVRVVGSFRAE